MGDSPQIQEDADTPTDKWQTIRRVPTCSRVVSGDRGRPENIGAAASRCPNVDSLLPATNQEVARSSRAGRTNLRSRDCARARLASHQLPIILESVGMRVVPSTRCFARLAPFAGLTRWRSVAMPLPAGRVLQELPAFRAAPETRI